MNALWAAGAEAVSVGGQRLAPTTTIRGAGEAILVDLRPVQSPYTLAAVGDPATLLPRFADSEAARRFQSYTGLYGIQFTVRAAKDLQLPAATDPDLRYASPVPPPTTVSGHAGLGSGAATLRRWTVIPALALVAGVALGLVFEPVVPLWLQPYLPIAVVAALDAMFGGIRARLDGIFDAKVFVVSFVSNVLVAALIVFLGDKLGVGAQLSTGVVVVLGIRIFGNAAAIRRHLFRA